MPVGVDERAAGIGQAFGEAFGQAGAGMRQAEQQGGAAFLDVDADMAPIGPLDFTACDQALASAGYTGAPNLGRYGQVEYWAYQRGDVSLQVHVRGESDAKAERACVSMIVINA